MCHGSALADAVPLLAIAIRMSHVLATLRPVLAIDTIRPAGLRARLPAPCARLSLLPVLLQLCTRDRNPSSAQPGRYGGKPHGCRHYTGHAQHARVHMMWLSLMAGHHPHALEIKRLCRASAGGLSCACYSTVWSALVHCAPRCQQRHIWQRSALVSSECSHCRFKQLLGVYSTDGCDVRIQ